MSVCTHTLTLTQFSRHLTTSCPQTPSLEFSFSLEWSSLVLFGCEDSGRRGQGGKNTPLLHSDTQVAPYICTSSWRTGRRWSLNAGCRDSCPVVTDEHTRLKGTADSSPLSRPMPVREFCLSTFWACISVSCFILPRFGSDHLFSGYSAGLSLWSKPASACCCWAVGVCPLSVPSPHSFQVDLERLSKRFQKMWTCAFSEASQRERASHRPFLSSPTLHTDARAIFLKCKHYQVIFLSAPLPFPLVW